MGTYQPYSTRLARGTLPMFHSQGTSHHYMRMEHAANVEALGMAAASAMVGIAGWIGGEGLVSVTGAIALIVGIFIWIARRLTLRHRRTHTPGMIFLSREGIGAIFPSGHSTHLGWSGISARELRLGRLPENQQPECAALVGLKLKDARGSSIYITHDLDGYNELLEILLDLDVPIGATRDPILGAHGTFTDWQSDLERRAG